MFENNMNNVEKSDSIRSLFKFFLIEIIFFLKIAIINIKEIIIVFIKIFNGKKKWIINAVKDTKIIPFNISKNILSGSSVCFFDEKLSL